MSQPQLKDSSLDGSDERNYNLLRVENNRDTGKRGEVLIPAIALSRQESLQLLRELVQLSSPQQEQLSFTISVGKSSEHMRLERIRQLEKALEQSLNYLHELKQKLKEQLVLEAQLAAAEEFANVQQQAIAQLKQQLAQQQLLQTQLDNVCCELEQERTRCSQLQQQNLTLQKYLIEQSQQTGEYEAAVQYWQELAFKFRESFTQLLPKCDELSEHPQPNRSLTVDVGVPHMQSSIHQQPRSVDLPPFLTKQRRS